MTVGSGRAVSGHAFYVTAIAIVVALSAIGANAVAQTADSQEWISASASIPAAAALSARERVRTEFASALDSSLPPVPFNDWLYTAVAFHLDRPWQFPI